MLLERFCTSQEGTLLDQLFALRQSSSVHDFQQRFEVLSAPLKEVADAVLESAFVNGLREDVRPELRLWAPVGLLQMMRVGQQIEDKNTTTQAQRYGLSSPTNKSSSVGFQSPTQTIHTQPTIRPTTQGTLKPRVALTADPKTTPNSTPFRRMTEAETQEKCRKGLCFRCDEKLGPGHRCKRRELQVLWMMHDEEIVEDGKNEPEPSFLVSEPVNSNKEALPPSLSLSSLVGLSTPHSLKLRGQIGDRDAVVLVDSGASHNFLATTLVEE